MKEIKFVIVGAILILLQWSCSEKQLPELYVKLVSQPVLNLNGIWKINTSPKEEFWVQNEIDSSWKDVQVPGEVMMQGFSIKNDIPFVYRKEIDIPLDFSQNKIYLQFDGVYSYSRVWVNGKFVRDHHGGFTRWTCDITPHVKAGEKAWITLEVTDRADDISYASGYAKHQIGGILRDVHLLALPKNHPKDLIIETELDDQYQNAELSVSAKLAEKGKNTKIELELTDGDGKEVLLRNAKISIDDKDSFSVKNSIENPKKWDAEHPNLYTLRISFYEQDELIWSKTKKIGFREIKVVGNSLLVNGKPVKLRGACRQDVHPTLGRVATPEYELKDVLLAKESNMNYIRTSHYPPSDNFLKLCDEYGIYVEDETAVCFVIDYRIKGYKIASKSQSDPEYTDRYLSQLKEMVDLHRNHPSVIIWSIGNESIYGSNFQKSFDWLRDNDNTRPIKFSYPGSTPDSIPPPYQILSMHYPPISGDLNQFDIKTNKFGYEKMPVIFDEWAHVACYNNETIIEDPNIRDFWGQSLDKMWIKTYDADGGLGGAIWGMIDETFMLPKQLDGFRDWWGINDDTVLPYKGTTVGYGEWGIVDVWRRKKPEFWNAKKAYSPIKILATTIKDYEQGTAIDIPIYNRFDHTNLNETIIKYTYNDSTAILDAPDIQPHKKGVLVLPITNWDANKKIAVNFYDINEQLIDSYHISQGVKESERMHVENTEKVALMDKAHELIVQTNNGNFIFDKKTGLLSAFEKGGKSIRVSGPFMTYKTKGKGLTISSNFINNYGQEWKLSNFSHSQRGNAVIIKIDGSYNTLRSSFELLILANGELKTTYYYENLPKENVREIGIKYCFDSIFDTLSWERTGYWSTYPSNHLSAISGEVPIFATTKKKYRTSPQKPWYQDTKSFYYEGTGDETNNDLTYIAKATKEHISQYALMKGDKKVVNAVSNGTLSCRLAKMDNTIELFLNNDVDYVDLSWGNYQRNIILEGTYNGEASIIFNP